MRLSISFTRTELAASIRFRQRSRKNIWLMAINIVSMIPSFKIWLKKSLAMKKILTGLPGKFMNIWLTIWAITLSQSVAGIRPQLSFAVAQLPALNIPIPWSLFAGLLACLPAMWARSVSVAMMPVMMTFSTAGMKFIFRPTAGFHLMLIKVMLSRQVVGPWALAM